MIPEFPNYLIVTEDYSQKLIGSVVTSEFERGPSKKRKNKSGRSKEVAFVAVVEGKNTELIEEWFYDEIGHGAYWFKWYDGIDGVFRRARLKNENLVFTPLDDRGDKYSISLELIVEI